MRYKWRLQSPIINGLTLPDPVLKQFFNAAMPIFFQHFPALLAPYDWVLKETPQVAESSKELMELQYDLPQAMLNRMLGDWQVIYPKYSMGLWEKGSTTLEEIANAYDR